MSMEHWELCARESIRDLVARYNANGDAARIDALLELFAEDALVEVDSQQRYRGLNEIRGLFSGAAESTRELDAANRVSFVRHFTATHQIDVDGPDAARGRCYFVVFTDHGADHWGRYVDVYRQVGGRWLFAERRVTVDARVPGGWGALTNRRLRGGDPPE